MSDYLLDPKAPPEKDVEALEALLSPLAYKEELDWDRATAPVVTRRPARRLIIVAVGALAMAAIVFLVIRSRSDTGGERPGAIACISAQAAVPWGVEVLSGAPSCGGAGTSSAGALITGGWIETDATSSARLAVADVGEIRVEPSSRLELTTTGPDRHRLELTRGRIHASVDAPPRLFVVGTPAAEAVDLGCEYDLVVDADGVADLTVTGGAVSLEAGDRTVLVPAGFRARSIPDRGPTPSVAIESEAALLEPVVAYFLDRERPTLDIILAAATSRDTLTLEGLLPLVDRDGCEAVFARLVTLSPLPFPWDQTDFGCHDVAGLAEAWRGLLEVETEQKKVPE